MKCQQQNPSEGLAFLRVVQAELPKPYPTSKQVITTGGIDLTPISAGTGLLRKTPQPAKLEGGHLIQFCHTSPL